MQDEQNRLNNIKLHVLSDIHLEFYKTLPKLEKKFQSIDPSATNILCLCGDIGYPHTKIYKWFITWCSEHFTKVFIITGNHEYYSPKYTISDIDIHLGYPRENPHVQQWNKCIDFVKEKKEPLKAQEQQEVEFM